MRKFASVFVLIIALMSVGCGDRMRVDDRPVPEGWSRVQVRDGYLARGYEFPLAGFTVDLPPGWTAGESWPWDGPRGWIYGDVRSDRIKQPRLDFRIRGEVGDRLERFVNDPDYVVTRLDIEGESAVMYIGAEDPEDDSAHRVGIYFERVPGVRSELSVRRPIRSI